MRGVKRIVLETEKVKGSGLTLEEVVAHAEKLRGYLHLCHNDPPDVLVLWEGKYYKYGWEEVNK